MTPLTENQLIAGSLLVTSAGSFASGQRVESRHAPHVSIVDFSNKAHQLLVVADVAVPPTAWCRWPGAPPRDLPGRPDPARRTPRRNRRESSGVCPCSPRPRRPPPGRTLRGDLVESAARQHQRRPTSVGHLRASRRRPRSRCPVSMSMPVCSWKRSALSAPGWNSVSLRRTSESMTPARWQSRRIRASEGT